MSNGILTCDAPEAVVKRAFFLAYQAAGGPVGMGWLQAVADATEDDVWANVRSAGDYPGGAKAMGANKPGDAYGDYVFGRMMKLGLKWTDRAVCFQTGKPRHDYQAWCRAYPTYEALVKAAAESVSAQN